MARWTNWARTVSCRPRAVRQVRSESEILEALREASARSIPVKVAGSGHSFTDIACTEGFMLSMDGYDGVLSVDRDARTATVQAGVSLRSVIEILADHGLALENPGEIGQQTVAGATSTGTHGTGLRYGSLSTEVAGMRLLTASGEVLELNEECEADTFKAAQVGLGALGVISTLTLRCVPALDLHVVEEGVDVQAVLETLDETVDTNEHAEFLWFPHTDAALVKRRNRTDAVRTQRRSLKSFVGDQVVTGSVHAGVARLGRSRPESIPRLARFVGGHLGHKRAVQPIHEVFAGSRPLRCPEMEYAIPREHAREALLRVRALIDEQGLLVNFPVEVRFVRADDIWLSPAYGRQSSYIALHNYQGPDQERYFRGVESIMCSYGGRPHWGKIHYRTASDLREDYPRWDDFASVRARLDPGGMFRNTYLDRVLGPPA